MSEDRWREKYYDKVEELNRSEMLAQWLIGFFENLNPRMLRNKHLKAIKKEVDVYRTKTIRITSQ